MATKKNGTDLTIEDLQDVAKILANETSLAMLRFIYTAEIAIQYSLIKACGILQPTCSKQLTKLIHAGLITKERYRSTRMYSINKSGWKKYGLSYRLWLS
jgi:DNA-binding MarR family transcriptional regulator